LAYDRTPCRPGLSRPPVPVRTAVASPSSIGCVPQLQCPPPSLALAVARRLAHVTHRAAASPEQELQRRPPPEGADHPAGSLFSPNQAPKSSLGDSLVANPPFPRPPALPVRWIPAGTAVLHGQGPNCGLPILSREFFMNQRPICGSGKPVRGLVAKVILK
jgi:hypothetical protein